MKFVYAILLLFLPLTACGKLHNTTKTEERNMNNPIVKLTTNYGEITLELYPEKAPETVKNFIAYVESGHYNGTIFHRVIDGFMIQGGGFSEEMKQKPTLKPIRNEADNRFKNKKGTIAMARTSDIHSATAQFFINVGDNDFLDFRDATPGGFGYCAFGQVVSGMDVVDKIRVVKTGNKEMFQNVPVEPVKILSVTIVKEPQQKPE